MTTRSKIVIIVGSALVLAENLDNVQRTIARAVMEVDPSVFGDEGGFGHFIDLGHRNSGSAALVQRAVQEEIGVLFPDKPVPVCIALIFPDPAQVQDVARAWGFSPAKGDRLFRVDAYKPAVELTDLVNEAERDRDGTPYSLLEIGALPDGDRLDRFILQEHVTRGKLRRFRFRVDTHTGVVHVVWTPTGDEREAAREVHMKTRLGWGTHRYSRDRVAEFVPCDCSSCRLGKALLRMEPGVDVASVGIQLGLYPDTITARGIDGQWVLQMLDGRGDTAWMADMARRMLTAGMSEREVFIAEQLQADDDGRTH